MDDGDDGDDDHGGGGGRECGGDVYGDVYAGPMLIAVFTTEMVILHKYVYLLFIIIMMMMLIATLR